MSGKIQNEDIKSSAEINAAGGTDAQLPNDSKIWLSGSLAKTLSAAIAAKDFKKVTRTINAQVGPSYTFVLSDGSGESEAPLVTAGNAGLQTFTVPPNSSVAFPIGTQIDLVQVGAGQTTVVAGAGVTVNSKFGYMTISTQYVGVTLVKLDTDTWVLLGDLIP